MIAAEMASTMITGIGALGAVVAYLFRIVMTQSREQQKTSVRLGRLEGEHGAIVKLSSKVLEEVHHAITERDQKKEPPHEKQD